MGLKNLWDGNVSLKGVTLVALVSLVALPGPRLS